MTDEIQKNKDNSQALLFIDRIMDSWDKIVSQFTSGRWLLTLAAAIIMVRVCWGHIENAKEFKEIIAVIIYAYFNKNSGKENKDESEKN